MTALALARLCAFSYLHLPERLARRLPLPLGEIARELIDSGRTDCETLTGAQARLLNAIATGIETAGLRLTEAVDQRYGSGFAAYVFRSRDGHVIAMRGSETRDGCAPSDADWWDNLLAPIRGSAQYGAVRALVSRYPAGKLILTGHSKGGNNALYGLAVSPNALARAVVFNAQGFGCGQLSAGERLRLRERGVNYVAAGDIVGLLLLHPERRVLVRRRPVAASGGLSALCARARSARAAHRLESLRFTEAGDIVPLFRD